MTNSTDNPFLSTELGFGQFRSKKICEFDNSESDYLLWALKNVRIPKPLWNAILVHLETKIIFNTETILDDKKNYSKEQLLENSNLMELDFSKFLEPRIEPLNPYKCDSCNEFTLGILDNGYISDKIHCDICKNQLTIEDEHLRFYFGWYKGWRISDFSISHDKEYLKWIVLNIESLTPNFKRAVLKKINE